MSEATEKAASIRLALPIGPIFTVLLLLLASCERPGTLVGIHISEELRELIRAGREIAFPALLPDFEEVVQGLLTPLDEVEDARIAETVRRLLDPELAPIRAAGSLEGSITHEEAAEEIGFLFDLFRVAYAGYGYFGGDEVFLPLRAAMLRDLRRMDDPLDLSAYLNDLLIPALQSVIADNHFAINGVTISAPSHRLYMSDAFVLRKTASGFGTETEGGTYAVVETMLGGNPVDAVLPTLTKEGELAWAFGLLSDSTSDMLDLSVVFENTETGERLSQAVVLNRERPERMPRAPMISTRTERGVKIIESRDLSVDGKDDGDMLAVIEEFSRSGGDAAESPVVILDLRGNYGGSSVFPLHWLDAFVGKGGFTMSMARASYRLHSLTMREHYLALYGQDLGALESLLGGAGDDEDGEDAGKNFGRIFLEWMRDPDGPAWTLPGAWSSGEAFLNENPVIVLTDGNIASAGEDFVAFLRNLENALFVGTNTSGTAVIGDNLTTPLPHSGITVYYGVMLSLRPDLSRHEGIGFKPDLWVPSGESLDRVLAFIERNGIRRQGGKTRCRIPADRAERSLENSIEVQYH